MERDRAAIVGDLYAFGYEPIECERLVQTACHQALVNVLADAGDRLALDDQRVEAVKRAVGVEHHTPAFGRIGIDVRIVLEIGGLLGRAVHGNAMGRLPNRWPCARRERQQCRQGHHKSARHPD